MRTVVVVTIVAVVTVVLGAGATRLDFATGQDSFLNEDSDVAIDNEAYQDLFGGENMYVLFTAEDGKSIVDLFTPTNLDQLAELEAELRASDDVFSVVSAVTALEWTDTLVREGIALEVLERAAERETDPAAVEVRTQDQALTLARAAGAGEQTLENPAWVEFLLFENDNYTLADDGSVVEPPLGDRVVRRALRSFVPNVENALLAAILPGNASLDELGVGEDLVKAAVADRAFENVDVRVTGTPTFLSDINDYLRGGMATFGLAAVIVMMFVLFLAFRVRWRLLPLLVILVGIVGAFGLLGYIGIPLTLVTISGLPILIGIGIDFAIQTHNRVEEEVTLDHDDSPFAETSYRLGPPLVAATIAAAASFLVMQISRVPMIRDFGIMLATGIAVVCVVGLVLPLAILGARERRSPSTEARNETIIERSVVWLGSLPPAIVPALVALAVIVPVVGLIWEDSFDIESDPINWADQSTDTVKVARFLEDETGFATTLGVFVETEGFEDDGIFTDQMGAFLHDFTFHGLETHDELASASSLVSTLSYLIAVPGATALPPTGLDMLEAYEAAPPDIQKLLVADNGNATQVNFQVAPSSLEDRSDVFSELETSIAQPDDRSPLPENATAVPAGLATVGTGLLDNLTANRAALSYLALIAVLLWLLIRYRRIANSLLALIPVLFALGGSSLIVGAFNITLSPITTVSGPLIIAACTEFTILMLDRYLEERRGNFEPRAASNRASARTGRAFVASAGTTVGGFAVLLFSPLPLLRDFGAVVSIQVLIALLSALVILPPLVIWVDQRGWLGFRQTAEGTVERRGAPVPATALAVVLLIVGGFLLVQALDEDDEALAIETVPATDVPATLPPPTTTLPPGPPERPEGLVAGGVYDLLIDGGADPGQARCTADALLAGTPEEELLAMGILPPSPEVQALVLEAATACGVPLEVISAASAAAGG